MTGKYIVFVVFTFAGLFIKDVFGSATIKINFLSHDNPEHRLSSGRCCEQGLEKNCTRPAGSRGCDVCTKECDYIFRIKLDHTTTNLQLQEEIFGVNTTVYSFKDMFTFDKPLSGNVSNPFEVKVNSYEGIYTLSVISYDDDEHLGIDLIDELRLHLNTSIQSPTNFGEKATAVIHELNGVVTSMNISISIICDKDYYGNQCMILCKARDDVNGHYRCDQSSGNIICLPGWTDIKTNCAKRVSSLILPSPSTGMRRTDNTNIGKLTSVVVNTKEILPSKSIPVEPMTSIAGIANCTNPERIVLELRMNGEISMKKINETFVEMLCTNMNQVCYNIRGNCQQLKTSDRISFDDITIRNLFYNNTMTDLTVEMSSAIGSCKINLAECIKKSIYESGELRSTLGVDRIRICETNGNCEWKHTTKDGGGTTDEKKDDHKGIIVGVVCAVLSLMLITFVLVYIRRKRLMKIQNLEEEKKEIVPDKETSSC